MSAHEQFAEDLALYALGSLAADERATLEKHLEECASCRRELEQLRGDLSLLSLSAAGPKPPIRARQRLMATISREPRHPAAAQAPKRSWWSTLGWVAAAATVVLCGGLLWQNSSLQTEMASLRAQFTHQENQLQQANQLVTTLLDPESKKFELVAFGSKPQPHGKAIYQRRNRNLIFLASNLPQLPAEKIYELWLFPANGGPPIAAGLFRPDLRGSATVVNPPLPEGIEAKTFAVTLEPESGSHESPRGTPVIVGE